ncbi:MAG: ABC transporter permease [Gemmatimonadetes bacterium]|nr:ABC transporter permease [Gemmatimonadota bacterium]
METLLQDIRYAARTLRKAPGFTLIAVTCLALGIASNTTVFSAFNAILVRPFPFTDPDNIAWLDRRHELCGWNSSVSYLDFTDWKAQAKSFSDMAAHSGRSLAITEGEEPERLLGEIATWRLFPLLGVRPQLGRLIREDEDQPGAPGVVLLSDALWRRRFAADSGVVGQTVSINNLPHTIIGVMPERFRYPYRADVWIPATPLVHANSRNADELSVVGRLAPGVSLAAADRELAAIHARLIEQNGGEKEWRGRAQTLAAEFIEDGTRTISIALMGAVTFVLLIACANVANLMLTRAAGRSREIAVRAAIGAGRWRIVRQLLTESVIIAALAGAAAVPLTWLGIKLIYLGIPAENPMPYYMEFSLDTTTLMYTAIVSLLTGVVFGLAPALQVSRGRVYDALKEGGRSGSSGLGKNRIRNVLVIAEVALSLILLVGASLFARSFLALQGTNVGYDTESVLTMRAYLPGTRYDSVTARAQRAEDLVQRVAALPGVEAVAFSNLVPMDGGGSNSPVEVAGSSTERGREPVIFWAGVAGSLFDVLGVKLLEGRALTDAEWRDSARVAVINQRMATTLWTGRSALGGQFRLAFPGDTTRAWFTVVGIVPDIRTSGLSDTDPIAATAYLPYRFMAVRNHGLMIRVASGDPLAQVRAVRAAIRESDAAVPVFDVQSLEKARQLSFWQYKLFGAMFGVFGAVALFLAAIGVYGVISFSVSQRTRDIGVRVALGASGRDVVGMIVRQGVVLAAIGIAIGLVGAFGVTRGVASILIGVSATDPLSFVGVALFLTAIAALASLIPARRATSVDPIEALRSD